MKQLADKTIFITGGASGIGGACVQAYLSAGAKVFVMDKDEQALERMLHPGVPGLGGFNGDVSKGSAVEAALQHALDLFGDLDCIHNNAGISSPSKAVDDTTEEEWDLLMNVNLKSIYWTTKYGINVLKKNRGSILNTSSMTGEMGQSLHAVYTASKGAVNALTKSMALDYAASGVRVNAIAPAGVWTPLLRQWADQQPDSAQITTYLNEIHALGYCPEGDVVADVAVFLLSDAARFVTGCIMPVSGGAELGYKK